MKLRGERSMHSWRGWMIWLSQLQTSMRFANVCYHASWQP